MFLFDDTLLKLGKLIQAKPNFCLITAKSSAIIWSVKSIKVIKGAKIRNRYTQVPQMTQHTNGKETNSQLDTTNESQEANPFPPGDHKAQINRRARRHNKHTTEKNIKDPQKKHCLGIVSVIIYWRDKIRFMAPTSPLLYQDTYIFGMYERP